MTNAKSVIDELDKQIMLFESAYQAGLGDLEMKNIAEQIHSIIDEETKIARSRSNDALKEALFQKRIAFARRMKSVSIACYAPSLERMCDEFEKKYGTPL